MVNSGAGDAVSARGNFWQTAYFAPLDGLRALSVLLVIAGHTRSGLPIRQYFSGGLGVGIFFILSGFLITLLLLRERERNGTISLGGFYIRRAARILPPYLLTVAVYLLIGLVPSQHDLKEKFLRGLPYFLTLRNEFVPKGLEVAFTHSWSLSVEEKFYFVWPLLFFVVLPRLKARWLLIPLTLLPLLISPTHDLPAAYFCLLLGCCLATGLHALRDRQAQVIDRVNRFPLWVVFSIWLLTYFASLRAEFRIAFSLSTAVLIACLLLRESMLSRALGSGFCRWIGKRTYSMYLFHAICLSFVESRLMAPTSTTRYAATVAIAYAASLGVAAIVYLVVEQPAIRFGKRLASAYAESHLQTERAAGLRQKDQTPEYTAVLHR